MNNKNKFLISIAICTTIVVSAFVYMKLSGANANDVENVDDEHEVEENPPVIVTEPDTEMSRIEAKNNLENYTDYLKNAMSNEKLTSNLNDIDKDNINKAIEGVMVWFDSHQLDEQRVFEEKQTSLEQVCAPILSEITKTGGMSLTNRAKLSLQTLCSDVKSFLDDDQNKDSLIDAIEINQMIAEITESLENNTLVTKEEFENGKKRLEDKFPRGFIEQTLNPYIETRLTAVINKPEATVSGGMPGGNHGSNEGPKVEEVD